IALDATYAYIGTSPQALTAPTGSIVKVPKAGGMPVTIANNVLPLRVVTDGTNVYFIDMGLGGIPGQGSIRAVSVNGGTVTTLVSTAQLAYGLAVLGGFVYWTTAAIPQATTTPETFVMKVPVTGGASTQVSAVIPGDGSYAGGLVVDASNVYWPM